MYPIRLLKVNKVSDRFECFRFVPYLLILILTMRENIACVSIPGLWSGTNYCGTEWCVISFTQMSEGWKTISTCYR